MSITFQPEGYRGDPELDDPLVLNMSQGRAAMILRSLGLDGPVGEIEPMDLMVAIIEADPIDSGAPVYDSQRPGHARMIEGAIRPGYHAEKYAQLAQIAVWAHKHGTKVFWA